METICEDKFSAKVKHLDFANERSVMKDQESINTFLKEKILEKLMSGRIFQTIFSIKYECFFKK